MLNDAETKGTKLKICCSSVGYSLLIKKDNIISLEPDRVKIGNGPSFGCVLMKDFLEALAKKVKKNTTSFDNYSRMYVPPSVALKQKPGQPLRTVNLFKHIQVLPSSKSSLCMNMLYMINPQVRNGQKWLLPYL